jgi:hypothetical protein
VFSIVVALSTKATPWVLVVVFLSGVVVVNEKGQMWRCPCHIGALTAFQEDAALPDPCPCPWSGRSSV